MTKIIDPARPAPFGAQVSYRFEALPHVRRVRIGVPTAHQGRVYLIWSTFPPEQDRPRSRTSQ